ncbi:MAG: segregation/condensation protein A, partial [Clostridiales bacterium]|nr:segregation/condensation protein A [Clostridiales bacterium]
NKSLFLIMAARLLEIKSQKLLPKPIYEDEDEEGAESKLIRQLQEYKLYKMACEKLKENEDEAKKRFYRLPEEIVPRTELDLEGVGIEALTQAFAILLKKFNEVEEEIPPREIERETFTVQEKMFLIRKKLLKSKRTSFTDLFTESSTKSEVIVTFMALLELSKLGRIIITQKNKKDTIFIESVVTEGKDNE